jgi:uncharacterized protein (TIGR03083 family)
MVRDLDDEAAARPVPTCPGWRVRDVVAHVTGVVDDALAGRLDGVATDPWTAAQVEARRDTPIPDILAEWAEKAPAFEGLLDAIGEPGRQAVFDVATHEHDIATALGAERDRDSDAIAIGIGFLAPTALTGFAAGGVSLRLRVLGGEEYGDESPDATLTGEPFELMRALSGRRSVDQLREMEWQGDSDRAIPLFAFGPFKPAESPIVE